MTVPLVHFYIWFRMKSFEIIFLFFFPTFFIIACQTSPLDFELADSASETATTDTDTDTGTANYVMDSDSHIVDWQYDTDDGTGGQDESCYLRTGSDGPIAWCDSPDLHAQTCDTFESNCCCRLACSPAICASGVDFNTPCQYFDIVEKNGYCSHPVDNIPVDYTCMGQCTPRSDCSQVDDDGSCMDADAPKSGMCLIYETEGNPVFCQKNCEMTFCDISHMCVPLFDSAGQFSQKGACVPVN
jgi:hypothetical protein